MPCALNCPKPSREMKTGNIGPVDLPQASIGPGMAIYSRYSRVLEADGSPLTVRAALSEINKALDAALEEPISGLDAETQFAVDWFAQHGYKAGDFGGADVLARAKNTSVESVALAGVAKAEGGKVRLVNWREYDPGAYDPQQDKRPTVWEGTHHLVEPLESVMARLARRHCSTDCRGISPNRCGIWRIVCIISASARAGRRMRWIITRWAAVGRRSTGWRRASVGGRRRRRWLLIRSRQAWRLVLTASAPVGATL